MAGETPESVTRIIEAAGRGDRQAARDLLPLVYTELRKLALVRMAKASPGNTLQPTALVHEAYLQLVGKEDPGWKNRGHFFGAAARAMRQILVDQARRKGSLKRGGNRKRIPLDDVDLPIEPPCEDMLSLDHVLKELEQADPRKGEIVMLKYFAGLTNEETAAALGISTATVEREWRFIRTFLFSRLSEEPPHEGG